MSSELRDDLDEYDPSYSVHWLPHALDEDPEAIIRRASERPPFMSVPVVDVRFDETKRIRLVLPDALSLALVATQTTD